MVQGWLAGNLSDTQVLTQGWGEHRTGWECTSKSGHENRLAHSFDSARVSFKSSPPAASNSLPHFVLELCPPELDQVCRGGPELCFRGLDGPGEEPQGGDSGELLPGESQKAFCHLLHWSPLPYCVINHSRLILASQTRTP